MADSPDVSGSSSERGDDCGAADDHGDGLQVGRTVGGEGGGDCAWERHVQWRKAPAPHSASAVHGIGTSRVDSSGSSRGKEGSSSCYSEKTPLLTTPCHSSKLRHERRKPLVVAAASSACATTSAAALAPPSPPSTPSTVDSDTSSTDSEHAQNTSIGALVAFFSLGSASDISWNAIYMSVAYFETLEGKGVISKLGLAQNIPWLLAMILMVAWPRAADSARGALFTILLTHIYMFSLCILFPVLVFKGIEVGSVVLYSLVAVNGIATGLSQSYVAACSALFSRDPRCRAATSYQLIGAAFGISTPTLIQLFLVPRMLKARSSEQSYHITIFSIKVVFPCAAALLLLSLIALAYVVRHANFKAAEREGITNCNAACGAGPALVDEQGAGGDEDEDDGGDHFNRNGGVIASSNGDSASSCATAVSHSTVAGVEQAEQQGRDDASGAGCETVRRNTYKATVVQAEEAQPLLQKKRGRRRARGKALVSRSHQDTPPSRVRQLLPVIAVVLAESFVSAVMSFSCAASPHLSPIKKTPFWNRNLDTVALICFSISGFIGRAIPEQAAKVKWLARLCLATPTMVVLVITQLVLLAGVVVYVHWRREAFAFLDSWDGNNSIILAWYAVGAVLSGTAIVGLSRYVQHKCRQSHVLPCSTVGQLVWLSLQLGSVAGIAVSLANGT